MPAFRCRRVQNQDERLTSVWCNGNRCGNRLIDGCRGNHTIDIERRTIMKRVTKITLGAVTVLSLGLAAAAGSAHPHGYCPGYGMGQDYGPGYGAGAGMGRGMGPMGQGPMRQGMGPPAFAHPGAFAEGRLAGLKARSEERRVGEEGRSRW